MSNGRLSGVGVADYEKTRVLIGGQHVSLAGYGGSSCSRDRPGHACRTTVTGKVTFGGRNYACITAVQITGTNLHWSSVGGVKYWRAHKRIVRLSLVRLTDVICLSLGWAKNGTEDRSCS